jgi:hypothetical protein
MTQILFLFFPSGLARRKRAKPEGKSGGMSSLPRAAAAAALRGAIFMPPLRGAGRALTLLLPRSGTTGAVPPRLLIFLGRYVDSFKRPVRCFSF